MAFGTSADQSLDAGLWIWGGEPCQSPTSASSPHKTAATLGSHGNRSWHPAIRVAVDIHWVDPFIKNQITSPCLINLASQTCILYFSSTCLTPDENDLFHILQPDVIIIVL